jgi:tRNA(Ile)-lysidine synthase TilS/MesJ
MFFAYLHFVEDSSNEKNDYTRNLIRNKLLPTIQEVYAQATENVLDTVARLKEAEIIVNNTIAAFWKKGKKTRHRIETIPLRRRTPVLCPHSYYCLH